MGGEGGRVDRFALAFSCYSGGGVLLCFCLHVCVVLL